uniref:Uncharacterized protein n=1 Tax=Dicentrarchus labrax TaxID=13489 RepID=A0A8C4EYQ8_DICLA
MPMPNSFSLLGVYQRLPPEFGSASSPDLNPIELSWDQLGRAVRARLTNTNTLLNCQYVLSLQTSITLLNFCRHGIRNGADAQCSHGCLFNGPADIMHPRWLPLTLQFNNK